MMSNLEKSSRLAFDALKLYETDVERPHKADLLQVLEAMAALEQALQQKTADRHIKLVPIRQLFDESGNQVCSTSDESCHFLVSAVAPNYETFCNHCQRGIPNNKPHRLCPVWFQS
jgi:hypothetical protein